MDEQDRLDNLLDRALATFTPANARPGLEDRIRARIAADTPSTQGQIAHPWRWIWAAGFAVAAAILVLAVVLRIHPRTTTNLPTTAHTLPARPVPKPPQVLPRPVAAHNPAKLRGGPRHAPPEQAKMLKHGPELQRGPSQQQLIAQVLASSPQAFALMARAQKPSGVDPDKPIEIRPLPDDPIVIAPIEIKPLEDSSAETGGRF
jgi:hypothetical protein